jgi:hypothetical protein
MLTMTVEQLVDACREVYEPGEYAHAPDQVFFDQFEVGHPPTTFFRIAFAEKFTHAAACKLDALRDLLQHRHGPGDAVFVIYFTIQDAAALARHTLAIADR